MPKEEEAWKFREKDMNKSHSFQIRLSQDIEFSESHQVLWRGTHIYDGSLKRREKQEDFPKGARDQIRLALARSTLLGMNPPIKAIFRSQVGSICCGVLSTGKAFIPLMDHFVCLCFKDAPCDASHVWQRRPWWELGCGCKESGGKWSIRVMNEWVAWRMPKSLSTSKDVTLCTF